LTHPIVWSNSDTSSGNTTGHIPTAEILPKHVTVPDKKMGDDKNGRRQQEK
jgi:hypothetical protein